MLGMLRQTRGYKSYGSPIHQTYYFAILVTPPIYIQVLELGYLHSLFLPSISPTVGLIEDKKRECVEGQEHNQNRS